MLEIVGKPRDDEAIEFGLRGHVEAGHLLAKHYKVNSILLASDGHNRQFFFRTLFSRDIGGFEVAEAAKTRPSSGEDLEAEEKEEVIAIIPQLASLCSGRTAFYQAVLKAIDSIYSKEVIPLSSLSSFPWEKFALNEFLDTLSFYKPT